MTYFFNGFIVKMLFYCHTILYWQRKCFSVSVLLMEVSECWNIVEFPKISTKMKNIKRFYEALWCSGYHYCTTSFNKAWTKVQCRFKSSWWCVGGSTWWGSLTIVPAGNKPRRPPSVNHTTKKIHYHHGPNSEPLYRTYSAHRKIKAYYGDIQKYTDIYFSSTSKM